MRPAIILLILFSIMSCKNDQKDTNQEPVLNDTIKNKEELSDRVYYNENWSFSFQYSDDLQVLEAELPGNVPVINLYKETSGFNPPFAIHEEPGNPYLAVMPEAFGVDAPSGKQISLASWGEEILTGPSLDLKASKVYLLESGEPWAFYLRFANPPSNWTNYGGMFVHFKIDNFKAECYSASGEKKSMESCDPMGPDEVRFFGNVEASGKEALLHAVSSFKFKEVQETKISDLIQVEKPLPNRVVSSPLKLSGKARGFWFFEADAPVVLLDEDNNQLAQSYIKAEGNWMTEDFVNFTGTIEFENPGNERGYLMFKRANPSNRRENDREYRLPVIFSHK